MRPEPDRNMGESPGVTVGPVQPPTATRVVGDD
jgi:hypothetical protein